MVLLDTKLDGMLDATHSSLSATDSDDVLDDILSDGAIPSIFINHKFCITDIQIVSHIAASFSIDRNGGVRN